MVKSTFTGAASIFTKLSGFKKLTFTVILSTLTGAIDINIAVSTFKDVDIF